MRFPATAWLALLPALFFFFFLTGSASAGEPAAPPGKSAGTGAGAGKGVLATLKPGHPRLILTEERLAAIRELIGRDEGARGLRDSLRKTAERLVDDPRTVQFKLKGPRLLSQSRRCLQRVYALSLLFRLDPDGEEPLL